MPPGISHKHWTGIISSVKTPLGFFALVALVVEAGLLLAGAPILVPSGLLAYWLWRSW